MKRRTRIVIATAPDLQARLADLLAAVADFDIHPAGPDGAFPAPPDHAPFDAAILDAGTFGPRLPELLARARDQGFCGPVILLCGADDAEPCGPGRAETLIRLNRPFRVSALRAAVETALAQCDTPPVAIGLRLTEKEQAIFERLRRADGAAVGRQRLLDDIWGCAPDVTTRTLETHIHRLRRKIEAAPTPGWRLTTTPAGYRLAKKTVDENADQLASTRAPGPR